MNQDWQDYETRKYKRRVDKPYSKPRAAIEHDYQKGDKVVFIKRHWGGGKLVSEKRHNAEIISNPRSNILRIKYYVETENCWYYARPHYSQVERMGNGTNG